MPKIDTSEIILKGIGASPGICIGKAYLVGQEGVNVIKRYPIATKDLADEVQRFKTAVQKSKEELREITANSPEDIRSHLNIFESHELLLKDKMLYGRTIETIERDQVNAEWALRKVVSRLRRMFKSMANSYLKDRASDIVQVSDRIMRNLVGKESVNIAEIDKRVILVAHDLSPAETSQIQLERIKGFVTDRGGRTSHTSIIARTLQIPAALGLVNATSAIQNDDILIVDGATGVVILHPEDHTIIQYEERRARFERYRANITRKSHIAAQTTDGLSLNVMGNIELPEEVVAVMDHGGDGIGLFRTEFQYMGRAGFPTEAQLFDKYRDVVEVIAPKPVTIRTLDINGDKPTAQTAECNEANPALGLRAIRYCLRNTEMFHTQLRAILRASAYGPVRVIFPMISGISELRAAKKVLAQTRQSLDHDGLAYDADVKIGIMIEVPSAGIMAAQLAREVDFFSIGTNDLIQYTLAIDRGNRLVADLYQPLHPAIIRLIKQVIDAGKACGIPTYMCGEMAADPVHIPVLLGLGIAELSMNPMSIPVVKDTIRRLDCDATHGLIDEIFKLDTAEQIEALIHRRYCDMLPKDAMCVLD